MPDRSPDSLSPAEELFADWLARREDPGGGQDLESLCREHPKEAAELRKLWIYWEGLRSVLDKAGFSSAPCSLAEKIQDKFGSGVDPNVSIDGGDEEKLPSSALLRRLAEHTLKTSRYKPQGEIARGGMGAILKVFDEDLRRNLAMKVILGKDEDTASGGMPPVDKRLLARFLEEAQITGQLDHPGIVPVHELGLDSEGRVYFTMKLVKGRDLKQIFDLVFEEKEGWNETRALGVLLKVCEAMAYAHKKGVIHRDLKPANVMVGNFGEVYVMDWGLARVEGREDRHDVRIQVEGTPLSSLHTERLEEREETPHSPLVTMDGHVVGTPAYMPPEQARGEVESLGPRSDVYSIGAMLYHLLARQMPYVPSGARRTKWTLINLVSSGPPTRLHTTRSDIPAELVAICERAMSREPEQRYGDTLEFAEDLRAYLEGRVVKAYRTGALAELTKWVERNKPLSASLALAVTLLVTGLATSLTFSARAHRNALLADEKASESDRLRKEAVLREEAAAARADALWTIEELKNFKKLDNDLEYARSQARPTHVWWLEMAHELIDGRPANPALDLKRKSGLADHRRLLAEIRSSARAPTEAELAADRATPSVRELESKRAELTWMSRMLGLDPWPSEEDVLAGIRALDLPRDSSLLLDRVWPWIKLDRELFGRESEALSVLKEVLKNIPEERLSEARKALALALFANGRLEEAIALHTELAAASPQIITPDSDERFSTLPAESLVHWTVRFFPWILDPQKDSEDWLLAADAVEPVKLEGIQFEEHERDKHWTHLPSALPRAKDLRNRFGVVAELEGVFVDGPWQIETRSDDGIRVWIDDQLEIDNWKIQHPAQWNSAVWVSDGVKPTRIRLHYYEIAGDAVLYAGFRLRGCIPMAVREWTGALGKLELQGRRSALASRIAELSRASLPLRFEDREKEWWNAHLSQLEKDLEELEQRIAYAEGSVTSPKAAESWKFAIDSIAACPKYGGLRITPQLELLPLGPDPNSGLWEFAHIGTGKPAIRGEGERLSLTPETGVVFVLLPGGKVPIENGKDSTPLHDVALDPFFLSKYEMTVAQWRRVSRWIGHFWNDEALMPAHGVSWDDCVATLETASLFLRLPTQAQWEYGCRAGTTTPWWPGAQEDSLRTSSNVDSLELQRIGALLGNPMGLHDVHGNVEEWCSDGAGDVFVGVRPGDGELATTDFLHRVCCGGSFAEGASRARSGSRSLYSPGARYADVGLRLARAVTP